MARLDTADPTRSLYAASRRPCLVDVPAMPFLQVDGEGPPAGPAFQAALQALYAVSYGLRFRLKKEGLVVTVSPLEACWTTPDPARSFADALAAGGFATADMDAWSWTAMIRQPEAVGEEDVALVKSTAAAKKDLSALALMRFARWEEGPAAQVLHVGPYAEELPTVAALHAFIAEQGLRPRGRHHEVYLGDPRRSAPERLRTILRQPVEPL